MPGADAQGRAVWDDFSGGEWGVLDEEEARKRKGLWHGGNVMVFENGTIGPRPGLRKYVPSGGMPSNPLKGFSFTGTPAKDILLVVGTTAYYLDGTDLTPAVTAFSGSLASTPTVPVQMIEPAESLVYFISYGDKIYKLNLLTDALSAVASTPGGRTIARYGDRLVAGGTAADPQRVFFSNAAVFDTWGASDYFDVGYGGQVRALFEQRGHLAIAMSSSEWWVVTGSLGSSDQLRKVVTGHHPWHFWPTFAELLGDDRVLFVGTREDYPGFFNGAAVQEHRHLQFNGGAAPSNSASDRKVVRLKRADEALVLDSSGDGLLFANGVWSFHDFTGPEGWATSDLQGRVFMSDGGDTGVAPVIYVWRHDLDRPGAVGDTYARPGDDSDTPVDAFLHLPEFWHDRRHEMRVTRVDVDFIKYDTGSSSTNHFDVNVRTLRRYGGAAFDESTTQSFDEAASSANASGTKQRQSFGGFGSLAPGNGLQVRFTNVRGCAFRSVTVHYDDRGRR